jgi:hypothetical protein
MTWEAHSLALKRPVGLPLSVPGRASVGELQFEPKRDGACAQASLELLVQIVKRLPPKLLRSMPTTS